MHCRDCNHEFPLPTGGQGFSDAPGVFLIASGVAFVVAVLGFGLLGALSETAGYVVGGLFLLFAVGALFLIPVAMVDAQAYGPCTCPQCGAKQSVYPWSL